MSFDKPMRVSFLLLSVSALVSGCSSTTAPTPTPTTPGQPPSGATYRTLADRTATAPNSTLGGVILTYNSGTGTHELNAISGTLTHSTGSTSLNVGPTTVVDANGPSAADGSLSAANGNFYVYSYNTGSNHYYFSGTYDYVTAFNGNYTALGVRNITGAAYGVTPQLRLTYPTLGRPPIPVKPEAIIAIIWQPEALVMAF